MGHGSPRFWFKSLLVSKVVGDPDRCLHLAERQQGRGGIAHAQPRRLHRADQISEERFLRRGASPRAAARV
jgi:hypothetical protein